VIALRSGSARGIASAERSRSQPHRSADPGSELRLSACPEYHFSLCFSSLRPRSRRHARGTGRRNESSRFTEPGPRLSLRLSAGVNRRRCGALLRPLGPNISQHPRT